MGRNASSFHIFAFNKILNEIKLINLCVCTYMCQHAHTSIHRLYIHRLQEQEYTAKRNKYLCLTLSLYIDFGRSTYY